MKTIPQIYYYAKLYDSPSYDAYDSDGILSNAGLQ